MIGLADAYHLGRELIDQEPNRSVQIRRRIDTRIPNPLLSVAVTPQPSTAKTLGNLGNLRLSAPSSTSGGPSPTPTPTPGTSAAAACIKPTSVPSKSILTPNSSHPSLATLGKYQAQNEASVLASASASGTGAGNGSGSSVNTPRHSRPVTPTPPVLEVKGKVGEVDEVDWDED